jgi:hypothetical protein
MTRFQMFPKIPKGILNFRIVCGQKDWWAKRFVGKKIRRQKDWQVKRLVGKKIGR